MDIREIMRLVRRVRIVAAKPARECLAGDYHSAFKGQGIEFDEVREYTPGDEVRTIDWNVTARMGRPFVKRFREERQLTVFLLVDVSGSQQFGSGGRSKLALAAQLACVLALSAAGNQDRVGLLTFSDRVVKFIPARRGRTAVARIVREVLVTEPAGGTSIAAALRFLNAVQKRRAVVFLISDFMDAACFRELRTTARKHDLVCCRISDPAESAPPPVGVLEIRDPETDQTMLLDARSRRVRAAMAAEGKRRATTFRETLRAIKADGVSLATSRPFIDDLRRLFHMRHRRFARAR